MSQTLTVARLAVRELWMTFRLILVLLTTVGAGALVGLLPSAPTVALERLAIGLAVASAVVAATAALTMAQERHAGRTGWLVTRSVPRGSYLVGWFVAIALVCIAGVGVAMGVGWFAASGSLRPLDASGFLAVALAVAATATAAVALGLFVGVRLPPIVATVSAVAAYAGAASLVLAFGDRAPWLPGGAQLLLARAAEPGSIAGDALRAAGTGLALTAALLVAARVALDRAEL
jgi:hypothetical protein